MVVGAEAADEHSSVVLVVMMVVVPRGRAEESVTAGLLTSEGWPTSVGLPDGAGLLVIATVLLGIGTWDDRVDHSLDGPFVSILANGSGICQGRCSLGKADKECELLGDAINLVLGVANIVMLCFHLLVAGGRVAAHGLLHVDVVARGHGRVDSVPAL